MERALEKNIELMAQPQWLRIIKQSNSLKYRR